MTDKGAPMDLTVVSQIIVGDYPNGYYERVTSEGIKGPQCPHCGGDLPRRTNDPALLP